MAVVVVEELYSSYTYNCLLWTELLLVSERTPSYPGASSFDAHLQELQKRYCSTLPPVAAVPPVNLPGVFPPTSLAAEWIRRERERFEILGKCNDISISRFLVFTCNFSILLSPEIMFYAS